MDAYIVLYVYAGYGLWSCGAASCQLMCGDRSHVIWKMSMHKTCIHVWYVSASIPIIVLAHA